MAAYLQIRTEDQQQASAQNQAIRQARQQEAALQAAEAELWKEVAGG